MVFRDSLQFLSALLEQLAASLAKVGRGYIRNIYDVVTDVYFEADIELLERKGVFCYDYLDSFARLDEPALPPREAFFNKLGDVECSQADYAHAQHVGKLPLPESQRIHNVLPSERHLPAGRRVSGLPGQLPGRVPARPGLLCKCFATLVERAPQTP